MVSPARPLTSSSARCKAPDSIDDNATAIAEPLSPPPPIPSPCSPSLPPSRGSSLRIESQNGDSKEPSVPSPEPPSSSTKPIHRVEYEGRKDSGLAPSRRDSRTTLASDELSAPSLKSPPSIPSIIIDEKHARPSSRRSERKWSPLKKRKPDPLPAVPPLPPLEPVPFRGITLDIPTGSFGDLTTDSLESIAESPNNNTENPSGAEVDGSQSKENQDSKASPTSGGGNNSNTTLGVHGKARTATSLSSRHVTSNNSLRPRPVSSAARALSVDEEVLSQKVRLMYEIGDDDVDDAKVNELLGLDNEEAILHEPSALPASGDGGEKERAKSPTPSVSGRGSRRGSFITREPFELAGGLEDWENIQVGDVDRYGFIIPRQKGEDTPDAPPPVLQRVSTSLLLASTTPRRKRTLRREPSAAPSSRSFAGRSPPRKSTEQSRPTSSQSSYQISIHRSSSRMRYAANRLPHNKNRKFVDEASDMLTLPGQIVEDDNSPHALAMKKKEWEREDKWRKMAKVVSKPQDGAGMTFEFDVKSSKLIERTWKGIPDRWRSTAWYAFLNASAKKQKDSPTDTELIRTFNELQQLGSPDDVQIDIDVPRTISSHIMFRRRYRGGQRLLFRVLHAMSLYFPDTGYVQGMAALAATLLAYYDEEHTFVMLVRLWQLRGLDRLYRSGFSGLMEALGNFEKEWLEGGEVAEKLTELGIPPTAYGTRWYLTLFNYSIPFPAQLRVWDVFMLLGDSEEPISISASATRSPTSSRIGTGSVNGNAEPNPLASSSKLPTQPLASPFGKSLDVLHATSAALIDGMRDIILESDFENAMKVLTSWIPIKDVEVFMRVARAEYKVHRRKKG
ncbi:GTPase-activating protein [Histoplasma capsulatum var. duboisii H88]|uniref:GTPase-activating protein n=1 Tax=Ajellomyces capsulatus (strain H88) TaxID=544711 RepID=F0UAA8_AJEC8|nr:GTPase-activating protein [Histoplasma capsulatum var. duboisii H88]QSS49826.1 GTPase activating protein [Histoplasma capsulatum var. duboisii H88]